MDKWDKLALLFGFLTVGALIESFNVFEETHERAALNFGLVITAICFFFTLRFFLKKKK